MPYGIMAKVEIGNYLKFVNKPGDDGMDKK